MTGSSQTIRVVIPLTIRMRNGRPKTLPPDDMDQRNAGRRIRMCCAQSPAHVLMPTSDVAPSGLAVASYMTKSGAILGGDTNTERAVLEFGHWKFEDADYGVGFRHNRVPHLCGRYGSVEFKAPNVAEQQAIAAVLSDMNAELQLLESCLAKARAVTEGMMQNLLTGRVRLV